LHDGFRSVLRSALAVTGVVVTVERLWQAWKCYREFQVATNLGDRSGAEGWQTCMNVDLVEAAVVLVFALGLLFLLRPRVAAP